MCKSKLGGTLFVQDPRNLTTKNGSVALTLRLRGKLCLDRPIGSNLL